MQTTTTEHTKREKVPKKKGEAHSVRRALELADIVIFFVGAVLGRTHLAFGAYPFGIAFLCALPHHVFIGLAGTVAGALSRGKSGILFAMIAFISLFVRILISGAEKHSENGVMFRENLTLRMSAGAVGGFVSAVYELLARGIVTESVLFSLAMIFGVALATVAFGLVYSYPITLKGALFHATGLFSFTDTKAYQRKKHLCIFSLLCYLLALTFGLSRIELLGVSLGGIFAFSATLFVARRFGAVCGAVVGFLCGVVIAPDFAVACALTGVASGLLFPYGNLYGEVSAVVASMLWGIYTGGAVGLLALLPEGLIGTLLLHPILTRVPSDTPKSEKESPSAEERVKDLLERATVSWERERGQGGRTDALPQSLLKLASLLHSEEDRGTFPSESEYRALLQSAMETRCKTCPYFEGCEREKTGFYLSAPALLHKLQIHRAPDGEDVGICQDREGRWAFVEALRASVGRAEEEIYQSARRTPVGDLVRTFGEMTREASQTAGDDTFYDEQLSKKLTEALREEGLLYAEGRVYGKRPRHIFFSGMDEDGRKISSPEIMQAVSVACGVVPGTPSYVREGQFVRVEMTTKKRFSLKCASAVLPIGKEGISGDVIQTYEGAGGNFFGILCDGTGSGVEARESAKFAQDVLRAMLDSGASVSFVLRLLDEVMRRRSPEDSTTLDMFTLDLYGGKAEFYKHGAVTSFIKRGDSLFSIRSGSLPLGIVSGAFHGERITATIEGGDMVVLFSDGVSPEPEKTPWLLELIAHTEITDPKTLAEQILLRAKRECGQRDDMSVLVCRVDVVA